MITRPLIHRINTLEEVEALVIICMSRSLILAVGVLKIFFWGLRYLQEWNFFAFSFLLTSPLNNLLWLLLSTIRDLCLIKEGAYDRLSGHNCCYIWRFDVLECCNIWSLELLYDGFGHLVVETVVLLDMLGKICSSWLHVLIVFFLFEVFLWQSKWFQYYIWLYLQHIPIETYRTPTVLALLMPTTHNHLQGLRFAVLFPLPRQECTDVAQLTHFAKIVLVVSLA